VFDESPEEAGINSTDFTFGVNANGGHDISFDALRNLGVEANFGNPHVVR
jgi:hypothetical protein